MRFAAIAFRNLVNRPMRSLLTALGVTVGVASFVALLGLSRGVETAWVRGLNERGTEVLAMRKGAVEILTATLDERLAAQLREVDGVADVAGELVDLHQLGNGAMVLLSGWPVDGFLWRTLRLRQGNLERGIADGELALGESLAAELALGEGDAIEIDGSRFRVRAITRSTGALNSNVAILTLAALQRLTHKAGKVTVFNLRLTPSKSADAVAAIVRRLGEQFPSLTFTQTSEIADNNKVLQLFRSIAWGTSAIALAMGVFIVLNTLLMSVTERKRDIGIFCALGWSPARIMSMIGLEALVITFGGSVCGAILGASALHWLVRTTALQAYVEPNLDPVILIQTLAAAVALGVLAAIYPAWRAARIDPVQGLRNE